MHIGQWGALSEDHLLTVVSRCAGAWKAAWSSRHRALPDAACVADPAADAGILAGRSCWCKWQALSKP